MKRKLSPIPLDAVGYWRAYNSPHLWRYPPWAHPVYGRKSK